MFSTEMNYVMLSEKLHRIELSLDMHVACDDKWNNRMQLGVADAKRLDTRLDSETNAFHYKERHGYFVVSFETGNMWRKSF